jgi:molybdopterin/thiamine biosynthesis adenylyltransferase
LKSKHLFIIGCGGVGSKIVPDLFRWNTESNVYETVHLIDGDDVELKNLDRQDFNAKDIAMNKAEALKEGNYYENFQVMVHPEFINSDRMRDIADDKKEIHILAAVDSFKTRKELNDWFNEIDDGLLISAGNEYYHGNVQMALRKNGKAITPDITCMHPEIAEPQDKDRLEMGCDEEIPSSPQLVFANRMAATLSLSVIYRYNEGTLDPKRDIYFDLKTGNVRYEDFPILEEKEDVQPVTA